MTWLAAFHMKNRLLSSRSIKEGRMTNQLRRLLHHQNFHAGGPVAISPSFMVMTFSQSFLRSTLVGAAGAFAISLFLLQLQEVKTSEAIPISIKLRILFSKDEFLAKDDVSSPIYDPYPTTMISVSVLSTLKS